MPIPYTCESCGYQGKAADKLAGKRVKCKSCDGILRLPSLEDLGSVPPPPPPPPATGGAQPAEAWAAQGTEPDALVVEPSTGNWDMPDEVAPAADEAPVETFDADDLIASDEGKIPQSVVDALDADDLEAGESDRMPAMRGSSTDLGPAPPPTPAPEPPVAAPPSPGLFGTAPAAAESQRQGEPRKTTPGPDERHCPKCKEVIGKQAKFCRFCGFDLNFEHLLTEEKVNIDINREREQAMAQREGNSSSQKGEAPRSFVRILGTLAVLVGFFLPWLVDVFEPPQSYNGFQLAGLLVGQLDPPEVGGDLRDQDEGEEIAEPADDEELIAVPHRTEPEPQRHENAPAVLAEEDSPARIMLLICLLALPLLALVALVWEAVRGGATISLGILALVASALAFLMLGLDPGILALGFYVTAVGAVLMLVPGFGGGSGE